MPTRISILELATLRADVRVSKDNIQLMDKLFKIGEENVIEEGVELLNKIKIIRGISDEQISEYTGIPLFKLKWILSGKSRITGKMADKLSKLGFNWSKR